MVLVRHFRHATRNWQWELPRGFGMPGTDPADDARRELRDEIGVEAAKLHELGTIYPDTGMTAAAVREEGITEIREVSPEELAGLIRDESIKDGFTITAYTRAVLRGHLDFSGPAAPGR
ncbi:NUDIX hydrolase [Actinoplanes sp. CA-051413]|uniref:NUDIX hydrolase n=1 Tax=Actinoplanes sp. CA-051413 TaxID=3239899 RepID=UPI003D960E51